MWLDISLTTISIILVILLPPLLDGVERKIKAKLHSRVGPPTVMQTWYDIRKLFSKELVVPEAGHNMLFIVLLLAITGFLCILSLPYGYINLIARDPASLIVFSILVLTLQLLWIILGISPGNPFSTLGAYREAFLGMVNEFYFMLGLFGLIIYSRALSFTGLLEADYSVTYILIWLVISLSAYVASGRIPFDIAEAEPELAGGVLVELSGPLLGTTIYVNLLKRAILYGLVVDVLIMPLSRFWGPLVSVLLFFAGLALVWFATAVISISLGRSRVDIAPRSLFLLYLLLFITITITWIWGL